MKRMRPILISLILAITLGGLVVAASAAEAWSDEGTSCIVSDNPDTPGKCPEAVVLWRGMDIADSHNKLPEWLRSAYSESIRSYPDLQSCLVPQSSPDHQVAHFEVRWDLFSTQYDAQVCLFRLFYALGSKDAVAAWLVTNGFNPRARERHHYLDEPREVVLSGGWFIKDKGPLWGTGRWNRLTAPLRMRGGTIQVYYDSGGSLITVDVYGNSQWN